MEPENLLPWSQHTNACPYPDPDESSSRLPTLLLRPTLILCSHLASGLLPSGLPTKTQYVFLFSPTRATWPAILIRLEMNYIYQLRFGNGVGLSTLGPLHSVPFNGMYNALL